MGDLAVDAGIETGLVSCLNFSETRRHRRLLREDPVVHGFRYTSDLRIELPDTGAVARTGSRDRRSRELQGLFDPRLLSVKTT